MNIFHQFLRTNVLQILAFISTMIYPLYLAVTNHTTKEKATAQCGVKRRSILRYVAACGGSVIGLTLSQSATAQSTRAQTEFTQTYGGSGQDRTRSVVQTRDGGYALAGFTESVGGSDRDFWLVKTDAQGNEQFTQTYGGNGSDGAQKFVQTHDGGYALAGHTRSFGAADKDFWLVKTDAQGNEQFNRTYGGDDRDSAQSVIQTRDGGYALAGATKSFGAGNNDFWLVKTDGEGNVQFTEAYGGDGDEGAGSLVQTRDGGYALTGSTKSFGTEGSADAWLVKTQRET